MATPCCCRYLALFAARQKQTMIEIIMTSPKTPPMAPRIVANGVSATERTLNLNSEIKRALSYIFG